MPDAARGCELTWPGKRAAPALAPAVRVRHTDAFDSPAAGTGAAARCRLYHGDNLAVMAALLPELRGRVDLVYLDPPFAAGRDFAARFPLGEGNGVGAAREAAAEAPAYRDVWDGDAYPQMLYERLLLVRELLAETGSLVVHVNWRAGHLVQLILDELFGPGERRGPGRPGFRNEIVWGYGGGGAPRRSYRRKHDNLFWYTRSDRWTFHPQYRPYTEKTRRRGLTAVKGPAYSLRDEGAALETWWTDPGVQKILSPTARENLKFPTQKPEALLERIVRGHSSEGDLVADFFCGSGTAGAAAARLGRRWIMADSGAAAVRVACARMAALQEELAAAGRPGAPFDLFRALGEGEQPAADEAGALEARPVRRPDGAAAVRLLGFRPRLPAGAPAALRERAEGSGFDFLAGWSVDFDPAPDALPFRHQWQCRRSPGARALPLESGAGRPGASRIAVKVVDVYGRETVSMLSLR